MKRFFLIIFAGSLMLAVLPACEHEREVSTTTTTQETVTRPAAVTTQTTRSVGY